MPSLRLLPRTGGNIPVVGGSCIPNTGQGWAIPITGSGAEIPRTGGGS